MTLAHELKRLRYEHAEMKALADQISGILALGHAGAAARLHPIWQQYQRQLTRHLKCEDWILYPRIKADLAPNVQQVAGDLIDDFGHLAEVLEGHRQAWEGVPELGRWPAFAAEIMSILALAEQRALREECDLFPMLTFAYALHKSAP